MSSIHPSRLNLVPKNAEPTQATDNYRRASPQYTAYPTQSSYSQSQHSQPPQSHSQNTNYSSDYPQRSNHPIQSTQYHSHNRTTPERELPSYRNNNRPQSNSEDWFESRRKQRDQSSISIWPTSPKQERATSPSSKRKSSKSSSRSERKSKKSSSSSSKARKSREDTVSTDTDSSDSEETERKRSKKSSRRSDRKESSGSRREGGSRVGEKEGRREKGEKKRVEVVVEEEIWDEKVVEVLGAEEGEEVGPLPLMVTNARGLPRNAYGGSLLKGEGASMAAYLAEGERIPRRGEIGMSSTQIETFEEAGYVMSGSRHRIMNAVRVRKENQVISAEEKRGILKLQAEEKAKRENSIVASFRELVDTRLAEEKKRGEGK